MHEALAQARIETPTILDVEASGFGPGSYPIEVGFALPDTSTHCYLIHPLPHWTHWNAGAAQVHGIHRELLLEKGRPVAEVAERLNHFLRGRTVYSDGWGYDFSWVALIFEAAGMRQDFRIETLSSLLSEEEMCQWEKARREVMEELKIQRHRASSDARILQATYLRIRAWSAATQTTG